MREIKFRGWNKKTKTYVDLKKITPLALDSTLEQDGLFLPFSDHIILEQFTGLHDGTEWEQLTEGERAKWTRDGNFPSEWKGKEIYEGDVVEADNGVNPIVVGGVQMGKHNGAWCLWVERDNIRTPLLNYIHDTLSMVADTGLTKLGNIHANPELLKEAQDER